MLMLLCSTNTKTAIEKSTTFLSSTPILQVYKDQLGLSYQTAITLQFSDGYLSDEIQNFIPFQYSLGDIFETCILYVDDQVQKLV